MPFTTVQLANQMDNVNLGNWANSTQQNQGPFLVAFTTYFNGIQTWITLNGGHNPFGWNDVTGLTRTDGTQVVLCGAADNAPFNDAFNDVRAHLNTPGFRLFQAAQAAQRLIGVLRRIG